MPVYNSEFLVLDGMQDGRLWEVMVRRDGGRLFQMSGSQTANARRPKALYRL